jgi:hypothetical protein
MQMSIKALKVFLQKWHQIIVEWRVRRWDQTFIYRYKHDARTVQHRGGSSVKRKANTDRGRVGAHVHPYEELLPPNRFGVQTEDIFRCPDHCTWRFLMAWGEYDLFHVCASFVAWSDHICPPSSRFYWAYVDSCEKPTWLVKSSCL